jgi:hypothetical protein
MRLVGNKLNNQSVSGEASTEFDISRGESGYLYYALKAPIIMMVNSAE